MKIRIICQILEEHLLHLCIATIVWFVRYRACYRPSSFFLLLLVLYLLLESWSSICSCFCSSWFSWLSWSSIWSSSWSCSSSYCEDENVLLGVCLSSSTATGEWVINVNYALPHQYPHMRKEKEGKKL